MVWYFCFSLTPRAGDNALIRVNGGVNALIRVYGGVNALLWVYGWVNALLRVYGGDDRLFRGFIRENVLLRVGWISPGLQVIIHGELVLSHPAIIFIHNYSFLFTILVTNMITLELWNRKTFRLKFWLYKVQWIWSTEIVQCKLTDFT